MLLYRITYSRTLTDDGAFSHFAELPRELWLCIVGRFDIDARVASQRIGRLDPARWQFLHLLYAQRLQRRAERPDCNKYADVLEREITVHRDFDAEVRYSFCGFGYYVRSYWQLQLAMGARSQNHVQTWQLHRSTNKYSCHVSPDYTDSDSDTDMED